MYLLSDRRGAAAALMALILTILGGLGAISVDAGMMHLEKVRLQSAVDSAALAGVQLLPQDPDGAYDAAIEYLELNYSDHNGVDVFIDGNMIKVRAESDCSLAFARLLGRASERLTAVAGARTGAVGAARGAVPFGVEMGPFEFGDEYILKLEGDGVGGNFRALALGGTGASVYQQNLQYGYDGQLSVGKVLDTEPGQMTGPTRQGIRWRLEADPNACYETVDIDSPRFLLLPMVQVEEYSGRTEVTILGFAAFFLEGYGNYEGEFGIKGRFLQRMHDGELSDTVPDYGLLATQLIRIAGDMP